MKTRRRTLPHDQQCWTHREDRITLVISGERYQHASQDMINAKDLDWLEDPRLWGPRFDYNYISFELNEFLRDYQRDQDADARYALAIGGIK